MRIRKSPTKDIFIGAPLYVCMQYRSNLPLSVIDEECLDLVNPDVPSDQREAKVFFPGHRCFAGYRRAGGGRISPTEFNRSYIARNRDTLTGRGEVRRSRRRDPSRLAVLTTPFFVDVLKSPPFLSDIYFPRFLDIFVKFASRYGSVLSQFCDL